MSKITTEKRTVLWAAALLAAMTAAACAVALRPAKAATGTPQLPNLVADPPDGTTLATDSSTGTPRLLLRFNGYIHNLGPGAVDFRGSRARPSVSKATEEEVARAKEKREDLPPKTEEEAAVPPMNVIQRVFTTPAGVEETNIERPHVDEPSSGEIKYVSADGHHHWHLQRAAKYSLWNSGKTAEAAPAQKIGFCFDDSQHVDSIGPASAVYADSVPPFRAFCQQYEPLATSLFEGISAGWRDIYNRELAFQWVDASNVLPGEYWLREDVNPLGFVKESGGANAPSYATSPTIIPGFVALAQSPTVNAGEGSTLTLTARAFNDSQTPRYTVGTLPQHGTLSAVAGNHVTYTPSPGYTGPDTFTFSAADPTSQFPTSPAVATVSLEVAPPGTGKTLLAGDATASYAVADQTTAGREEAFQFTAKASGTAEEMQFRTNTVANGGVTGLKLGVFADSAGKPGAVLAQATAAGQPPTSSWIKATGLSVSLAAGTKYWLVVLPLGSGVLRFNAAVGSGGAPNVESSAGGLSTLTAQSSWVTYNQGPVGFQALGSLSLPPPPSVTIEGAPASMIVGSSVQLKANVSNDSPTVTWTASAGAITSGGLYTAPAAPPPSGSAVVTATTSKGAQAQKSIEISQPAASGLLVGDATTSYAVGDQTTAGREEAFQFTARATGTVQEMQLRTNGVANAGVTGVALGILSENAGKPGEVLGQASVSGTPAINSWIRVTGVSIPVAAATKYWLVLLPLGSGKLHYNAAVGSGGAGNVESVAAGLTALAPESGWETYNQGPVGFQALGAFAPASSAARASAARARPVKPRPRRFSTRPRAMIQGLPARITAGTGVQLQALLARGSGSVRWRASAGAVGGDGLYRAPAAVPRGGSVVITATAPGGARDSRRVAIAARPAAEAAPTLYLAEPAAPKTGSRASALPAPQAMLVDGKIIMAVRPGRGGRIALGAWLGGHRLGGCSALTPAGRSFTCRVPVGAAGRNAQVAVHATLASGGRTVRSTRGPAAISPMHMLARSLRGVTGAALQFICGPAAPRGGGPTA